MAGEPLGECLGREATQIARGCFVVKGTRNRGKSVVSAEGLRRLANDGFPPPRTTPRLAV